MQQDSTIFKPKSILNGDDLYFEILTHIPTKGIVSIQATSDTQFIVYGNVNIIDPLNQLYISGFQLLNSIYNAEVDDKLKQETFKGTLTNYLYQGYGSLSDLKNRKEYIGQFNRGQKLGLFKVIDLDKKDKINYCYFDENGKEISIKPGKEADEFIVKCDQLR